jgi:Fic family protein
MSIRHKIGSWIRRNKVEEPTTDRTPDMAYRKSLKEQADKIHTQNSDKKRQPNTINRPEFIAKFPGVKERLERKEISFRKAYQELDVSYATLKRALEKDAV